MTKRERIQNAVKAELPESFARFEDNPDHIRFAIYGPSGILMSQALPHLTDTDVDAQSDEQLRAYVRRLCGLKPR